MQPRIHIRKLSRKDLISLHRLLLKVLTDLSGTYYPANIIREFKKMHTIRDLERRVLGRSSIAFGAFTDQRLIAFMWGRESFAGDVNAEWGGVHPLFRERGVFSKLLRSIERELYRRKCYKFWFYVSATNIPAIKCYTKAGYALEGIHPNHFFGWDFVTFGKVIYRRRWKHGLTARANITSVRSNPPQLRVVSKISADELQP